MGLNGMQMMGTVVETGQLASCLQMIAAVEYIVTVYLYVVYSPKYLFKLIFFLHILKN